MKIQHILFYIIAIAWLSSCSEKPHDATDTGELPPIFPDYVGVTVPSDIAPLNFAVIDSTANVESVYVTVTGSMKGDLTISGDYANFHVEKWHQLTAENTGGKLTFSVNAKINNKWLKYRDFDVYVSSYPLDQWGLTYRLIAPGYEVYSRMGIYQRDLSNFDEFPIIENTMTNGQCYNCHTPNHTDPSSFVFHVRGDHGATMIQRGSECTWLKAINDSLGGAMVYPYWHPSGRYIAFSTNQTRQGFHVGLDKRLEVFDLSSDVLVYDVEKNEIILDTLLSSKTWSENTPVFSPDGKNLYFTTCIQQEYPADMKKEQYNLCRVSFDESTGKITGPVDTLFNAVARGKSVTWPRPSYDGRYLIFTLNDYGYFSIWHKESDQWLYDLATGEAAPIDIINSDDADSYHNWSDNSHWLVFTSRRDDGLYSRLYLTSVDDNGTFTKPFLLPQADPLTYYTEGLQSFNTPDFTKAKVDFDSRRAVKDIISPDRLPTKVR